MSDDRELEQEQRAIYAIIALAISPVLVMVVVEGSAVDAGATLSMILVALAIVGIAAGARAVRSAQLPRARIHGRRNRA